MARRSTSSATSRRAEADPIRCGRGFTILELLVVIGVVLAIGALALPFTLREIERRQEAEAFDRLGLLCRMARAEARASGVPVVLRVDESGRRLEARRFDPRSESMTTLVAIDADTSSLERDDPDETTPIGAAWAGLVLPDGARCEPPPASDESFEFESGPGSWEMLDADEIVDGDLDVVAWDGPTTVVLFLPDGAAIVIRPFGVRTSRGFLSVDVDPFGGRPSITSYSPPPVAPETSMEDEAAPEEESSPEPPEFTP